MQGHRCGLQVERQAGVRVRFVVFDNGNQRREGYEIDERQMLAAPTFSLGSSNPADPSSFHSKIRGDADILPEGDRLQYVVSFSDRPYIAEVTYPGGEEIWRAQMPSGTAAYRVSYFPSLYETRP